MVIIVVTPLCFPAVPRSVQQLLVRHADEASLSIVWSRPLGEWDSFTILLRLVDSAAPVAQRILPWESRECTFNMLTSGRRYTVTVATNSGNLSSLASVTAWTSMSDLIHDEEKKFRAEHKHTTCLI